MSRYTRDSVDRVRDAVDFAELVGARTELRRAGPRSLSGLCPFHEERSPSFSVDPVTKLYHCFGCGAGGDLFSFVMETESVSFGEAIELLADRYNVQLQRDSEDPRAAERRARRERLYALLERTAAYYVRLLWESPEAAGAREYLASRGLEEGVLREFRVGYSPSAWDRVVVGSQKAGFTVGELLGAGLAQRGRDGGGRVFDRFRGRLMFPLADARGRVLGFGARALAPDDKPKYLNSAEGEVFSKGQMVFGTHIARADAAKVGSVVLVEGYTDVIALHQAGIRNAVGSMGTALTEDQAGELAKLAGSLLLCLDADTAGQEAMIRAATAVRSAQRSLELRVVPLPPGSDPADIVQTQGADAVRALLDAAVPFERFQVERSISLGNLSTPEGRDKVLAEVARVIRPLQMGVLRQELERIVADRLGLSERVVAAALAQVEAAGTAPILSNGSTRTQASRALSHREDAERGFLALCLALPAAGRERLKEADVEAWFEGPVTRRAAELIRDRGEEAATGLGPEEAELSRLMAELVMRSQRLEAPEPAELDRATLHLELGRLERAIASARLDRQPLEDLAIERQRVLAELRKLTR